MKEIWIEVAKGAGTVLVALLTFIGFKRFAIKRKADIDERKISIEQLQFVIDELKAAKSEAISEAKAEREIRENLQTELNDLKIQFAKTQDALEDLKRSIERNGYN